MRCKTSEELQCLSCFGGDNAHFLTNYVVLFVNKIVFAHLKSRLSLFILNLGG